MAKKQKPLKNLGGRPPLNLEGGLVVLESYEGCGTVTDMCEVLNISNFTFYEWMKDERFSAAVRRARDFTDDAVENAMLKRALGFEYEEVSEMQSDGSDEKGERYRLTTTKKVLPGDVGAQKNWLHNRRPDRWREKTEIKVSGDYHELLKRFAHLAEEASDGEAEAS